MRHARYATILIALLFPLTAAVAPAVAAGAELEGDVRSFPDDPLLEVLADGTLRVTFLGEGTAGGDVSTQTIRQSKCGGIAPVENTCTQQMWITKGYSISVSGFFTGQIVILMTSTGGGMAAYSLQVVSGLIVTASSQGALYAGVVTARSDTSGLFGFAGTNGGVGTWQVIITYE